MQRFASSLVRPTLACPLSQLCRSVAAPPQFLLKSCSMATNAQAVGVPGSQIVQVLKKMSPLKLAANWDNVGLLVEPTQQETVQKIFLTNDLTEEVVDEAISQGGVGFIVSYHPPIFVPLKRLTTATFKERVILKTIEAKIAVYSPHTSLDAVGGGVNDWLAMGVGEGRVEPLSVSEVDPGINKSATIKGFVNIESAEGFCEKMKECCNLDNTPEIARDMDVWTVKVQCRKSDLPPLLSCTMPHSELTLEVRPATSVPSVVVSSPVLMATYCVVKGHTVVPGCGRLVTLDSPVTLSTVIERVKRHLNLNLVRLAVGSGGAGLDKAVQTVAICAGSGSTVLSGVAADVFLTGEMTHHSLLEANAKGTSVILCEHSNTERGYLAVLKESLLEALGRKVEVVLSQKDRDPVNIL